MSKRKMRDVPDSVCRKCSQWWEGQCTAFLMPHSEEERVSRARGKGMLPCYTYLRKKVPLPVLNKFDRWSVVVLVLALLTVGALLMMQ